MVGMKVEMTGFHLVASSVASSAVLMGCSMVDLKVALTVELLAVLLVTLKAD